MYNKKLQEMDLKEALKIGSRVVNKNVTEDNMTFTEEIPKIEVKESFYKSMMQNQFLHHLRNKNVYIAIQTVTNELYIGTLISFDEYTLHVYVEDKYFNSAMLFFKSGLTYIRVLTEAAYQYYVNKRNNEFKKDNNSRTSFNKKNSTFTSPRSLNSDNNYKTKVRTPTDRSLNSNDLVNTLSSKFNVSQKNNKR